MARFLSAARRCAGLILDGAMFVQKELPKVRMEEALRSRTRQLCDDLNGTKHDVVSELLDFGEPIEGRSPEGVCRMRVQRIQEWLFEYLPKMHAIVQALETAAQRDPNDGGAYVLVAETAVGILQAYGAVREAAERVLGNEFQVH